METWKKRLKKIWCHNTIFLIIQKEVKGEAYLMQRLRAKTPEVPHHVWILQVSLRVPLLAMDEGWKLICPERRKGKKRSSLRSPNYMGYTKQLLVQNKTTSFFITLNCERNSTQRWDRVARSLKKNLLLSYLSCNQIHSVVKWNIYN